MKSRPFVHAHFLSALRSSIPPMAFFSCTGALAQLATGKAVLARGRLESKDGAPTFLPLEVDEAEDGREPIAEVAQQRGHRPARYGSAAFRRRRRRGRRHGVVPAEDTRKDEIATGRRLVLGVAFGDASFSEGGTRGRRDTPYGTCQMSPSTG